MFVNFTALSSIEPELLQIEVAGICIGIFAPFCSCNPDLKPMTFTYEVDRYPLKLYSQTENKLSTSVLSNVVEYYTRQTDKQTYRHTDNSILPPEPLPHRWATISIFIAWNKTIRCAMICSYCENYCVRPSFCILLLVFCFSVIFACVCYTRNVINVISIGRQISELMFLWWPAILYSVLNSVCWWRINRWWWWWWCDHCYELITDLP